MTVQKQKKNIPIMSDKKAKESEKKERRKIDQRRKFATQCWLSLR